MADNKSAVDIYFETSWLMEYLMNQQKGLWERPNGGKKIVVPLKFEEGGWYARNARQTNRTEFTFGNASIYRTDELENAGEYAEVQLVTSKLQDAQETCRDKIATSLYDGAGDSSKLITGLLSLTSETTTLAYGGKAEDDIVAEDGTKPWEGKTTTAAEAISLPVIRALRSLAKVNGGKAGKPTIGVTTETLFNTIAHILQVQQRFTTDTEIAKAGFTGVNFEGFRLPWTITARLAISSPSIPSILAGLSISAAISLAVLGRNCPVVRQVAP